MITLLLLQLLLCVPGSACFPAVGDAMLIHGDNTILRDVSNNYWGGGSISTNVTYSNDVPCSLPTAPTVYCSDGTERAHKGKSNPKVLSTLNDSSTICTTMYFDGKEYVDEGDGKTGRDTLEAYIIHCYSQPNSWRAFDYINGSISQDPTSTNSSWLDLRNWLFSVLYLNPDTLYYCADAESLLATFAYFSGARGLDWKGKITVEKYIVGSGKCPMLDSEYISNLPGLWRMTYIKWLDTVKDSLATPFDSTLPTLQQIGFEILLGPQYQAARVEDIPTSVLGAITATPNPYDAETEIRYTLNVPATLTVEVFDLLGKKVATLVPGTMTQNGDGTLKVAGLSPGSYYVRFSVPEGEIRTIKLVKE